MTTPQGVGGRATSRGISLRGGENIRRFLANASDGGQIARLTAKSVNRRVMPGYRRDLPKRTGRLASRVNVRARGRRVELRGIGYGRFVTWLPPGEERRKSTVGLFFEHLARVHRQVARDVYRGLL